MSKNIVYILFAVLVLYMFLTSLVSTCVMVYTDEHTFYLKDYALVISAGLICFLLLLTFVRKSQNYRKRHEDSVNCLYGGMVCGTDCYRIFYTTAFRV